MEVDILKLALHIINPICIRIGSEKRNIFGTELKASIAPGPGIYDMDKGQNFVKGKFSPRITMGLKYN